MAGFEVTTEARSGERAAGTLIRVAGYRRTTRGDSDAHLFAQTRTLRIRHIYGLKLSTAESTSPLLAAVILTLPDFHEVPRAASP
jgi:hypothetical protein